jgi:hypothetical protein
MKVIKIKIDIVVTGCEDTLIRVWRIPEKIT